MLQLAPGSVGKLLEFGPLFAPPVPELVTVTVKPICSPALTEAASAVLVIVIDGQFKIGRASCRERVEMVGVVASSLEAVTSAVLDTVPQVAEVVVDTTCAEVEPVARSAGP